MQFTGIVESRVRELYYQVRSLTLSGSKQLADTTRCARVRNFQGNLARTGVRPVPLSHAVVALFRHGVILTPKAATMVVPLRPMACGYTRVRLLSTLVVSGRPWSCSSIGTTTIKLWSVRLRSRVICAPNA